MSVGPPPLDPLNEMKAAAASMKLREADHRRGSEDEALKAAVVMHERLCLESVINAIEARAKETRTS